MQDRVRDFAWETTPLGPVISWSPVLLGTVNLVLASPLPMQLLWGREFIILYNEAFASQMGALEPVALGRPGHLIWQDAWPVVEAQLTATLQTGATTNQQAAAIPMNRHGILEETFWDFSYSPVYEGDGTVAGVLNISREVTAEVLTRRELEETERRVVQSEAYLKVIIDALPAYVSYIDRDTRYVRVNRAYEQLLGRSADAILGRTVDEVFSAPAGSMVRETLQKAFTQGRQSYTYEFEENGTKRILSVSQIPDVAPDGQVRGVVIEAHDITGQKRVEETLKRSEERFRSLIERSSVGLAIGSTRGELTYLNPALLALLGYTAQEVADGLVRWDQLTPEAYADVDQRAIEQLNTSGVAEPYEKAYLAKDGTRVPLLIGASVIPSEFAGEKEDVAVFATDLTLQKRAEAVLLQTEKLAAVGKLASSISHEINNPLEAVTNLLYIARQDAGLSQPTRDTLDAADHELLRVAQVTAQTLRFHRQSTSATEVHPEELLEEVLRIFGTRIANAHIGVHRDYLRDVVVRCYEGDIRQIYANLIGNAVDAMRTGGELKIRTRFATRWSTGEPGVRVTIADTGPGMTDAVRHRIFEAFYTTKGINGTGLGLWISSRIIHKHNGYLRVHSCTRAPQTGTVFHVWLPAQLAATASEPWQYDMAGG